MLGPMMRERRRYIAVAAVLVVAAVQTLVFWSGDDVEVARAGWLLDDAFFYAVIAERLVETGRLEFYPGMPTNGFQPLWLAVVAGAHGLVPEVTALEWIRYLGVGAYLVFCGLALLVVTREVDRPVVPATCLSVVVLLQPGFQRWVLNGMETALTLAVVMAAVWQTARIDWTSQRPSRSALAVLAVLCALCFLARTDLFVVGLVLVVWVWWRYRLGTESVLFTGLLAAIVVPYLAANLAYFGSVVPISGAAKQFYIETFYPTLGAYLESDQWRGLFDALAVLAPWEAREFAQPWSTVLLIVGATTGMLPVLAGYAAFRDRSILGETGTARALRIFAVAAGLHLVVMYGYLRSVRPHDSYYFAPTVVLTAVIVVIAGGRVFRRWSSGWSARRRLGAGLAVGVVLVGWGATIGTQTVDALRGSEDERWSQRVELAEDIDEQVPGQGTVGAYWPGLFAYFADHEVMPLDGVIASLRYQREVMRDRRALEYLCTRPAPHLAVYLPAGVEQLREKPARPEVPDWSWAHIQDIWAHGGDFEVAGHRGIDGGDVGWYLLRVSCGG